MRRFDTIVVHERPHFDEIVAIWLLRKFGEDKFPGISTAKVIFWSTGGETPDGRSAEEYERDGVLLVGIGRGRFDEHPIDGEQKQNECAATLVAKTLEIDDEPALKQILGYTLKVLLKASSQPFALASIVKLLHSQYPTDPEKVMEWAIIALEAKFDEQLGFKIATRQEFEKNAEIEKVAGSRGRMLKMVTVVSDNEQMNKFARSVYGGCADIIVQKQTSGNVQIFTNKKSGLKIYDIAQMLRRAEQEAKGRIITTDWKTLASEGKVEGVEEWFFHLEGQMLLNGSLTARDVPPTRLSLEEIKEIVRIGINSATFEPGMAISCRKGVCTSTPADPCPWYKWGLHRCRKIRFNNLDDSNNVVSINGHKKKAKEA